MSWPLSSYTTWDKEPRLSAPSLCDLHNRNDSHYGSALFTLLNVTHFEQCLAHPKHHVSLSHADSSVAGLPLFPYLTSFVCNYSIYKVVLSQCFKLLKYFPQD